MWYVKALVQTLLDGPKEFWVFTTPTSHPSVANYLITLDPIYAEAFGPTNVEIVRQEVMRMMPSAYITLVECSTRNILTPEMCRVLNLEGME